MKTIRMNQTQNQAQRHNKGQSQWVIMMAVLVMLMLPLGASADPVEIVGIWYNLDNNSKTAVVTRNPSDSEYKGSYSGKVTIPEKVTHEGVEYGVTTIGEYAFRGCSGLTAVTIHNSVTFIGYWAFFNCSSLTSVSIPASVTHIADAFDNCSSLTSISVDKGNMDYMSEDGVLMSKDGTIFAANYNHLKYR